MKTNSYYGVAQTRRRRIQSAMYLQMERKLESRIRNSEPAYTSNEKKLLELMNKNNIHDVDKMINILKTA